MSSPLSATGVPLPLPPADVRLVTAIREPQVSAAAVGLVRHALLALSDMQRLDESLYERYQGGEGAVKDDTSPDLVVRGLSSAIFRGLRAFIEHCRQLRPQAGAPAGDGGADFDFGDLEAAAAKPADDFNLDAGDIGDVLSGLDEHKNASEPERLAALLEKVSSVEYGLSSQLEELEQRLAVALRAFDVAQAIELLDDTQSSASEGVFAALTAVYAAFLPEADASTLAPGYLTTLQRALLVRRGLADLAREVNQHNDVLQADDAGGARHTPALAALCGVMGRFVKSDAFRAMRPADRFQVARFERQLREQATGAARLTSEGLARYLESLGSINRREVLVLHDQRRAAEVREGVAAARQLGLIRGHFAVEPTRKAVAAALALYGRSPASDDLITPLRDAAPALDRDEVRELALQLLERLLQVVAL